jgi:hypothetical protein
VSRFAAASTWLVRGGEVAVALIAGAGAAAKLVDPRPAFELAEAVTASPWASAAESGTANWFLSGLRGKRPALPRLT